MVSCYVVPLENELNVSDNLVNSSDFVCVTNIGDITGFEGAPDGVVNIRDIAAVAVCYGAFP